MGALRRRLSAWAMPVLGILLLVLALDALHREIRGLRWADLVRAFHSVSWADLLWAAAATVVSFFALTLYDRVAFAYAGRSMPYSRVAHASFVAYAIANTVGFAAVSGASVRYRYYSRWGVRPGELSRVIIGYSTTFWLGLIMVAGATLALHPADGAARALDPFVARTLGVSLLFVAAVYAALPWVRRRPFRLGLVDLPIPSAGIVASQLVVSVVDWVACSAVLRFLLPPSDLPFSALVGSFVVAQLVALVSTVPGGLGVFESLMVLALKPYYATDAILVALLLFRFVYYFIPFLVASAIAAADELHQRREAVSRAVGGVVAVTRALTPRVLAALTFGAGTVLLFSGATPGEKSRLELLARLIPLPAIEASHFLGSLAGLGLVLLANGVRRRLDASYYLAQMLIGVGIASSLLKGVDYEEATLLAVLMMALWGARGWFDRRAALADLRFSPGYIAAVGAAVGASIWLGLFAYRHVEYSQQLWWQFALNASASRFLRGSVGVTVALVVFAGRQLLRPARPDLAFPDDAALEDIARICDQQSSTNANLVFLRDKAVLFDPDRRGFLMYAIQGDTWVAMGDPVGPAEIAPRLIAAFLERCDDHGDRPAFYEVGRERLHLYADFGLAFVKLGEEARVPLQQFNLDGGQRKGLRMAHRRVATDGGSFRVLGPGEVEVRLDELQSVSEEWLRAKGVAEKGFSLGFFARDYVRRFPVAVIERAGRIEAFANLWVTGSQRELSVDLMRHRDSPIRNLMEGLFVHLLLWGREQGYEWFSLGMAPLSGLSESPVARLWSRAAGTLYEHGERFYNFQGLRGYKEKFGPVWEPRYLAYSGGLNLVPILADVSALIAGGYHRIILR